MNERTKDQETLWWSWSQDKSTKSLGQLMDSFDPMIKGHVSKLGSQTIPRSALEGEARVQAMKAFDTYDPGRGTRLSTHLGTQLQKVNRYAYDNQRVGRLPEGQILRTSAFQQAKDEIEEQRGRPPTTEELSRHLKWSQGMVSRMQRGLAGEVAMSTNPVLEELNNDEQRGPELATVLKYMYHDLEPDDRLVFEHTFGYGGRPEVDTNHEIAKQTGFSESKVRTAKKEILRQIEAFK